MYMSIYRSYTFLLFQNLHAQRPGRASLRARSTGRRRGRWPPSAFTAVIARAGADGTLDSRRDSPPEDHLGLTTWPASYQCSLLGRLYADRPEEHFTLFAAALQSYRRTYIRWKSGRQFCPRLPGDIPLLQVCTRRSRGRLHLSASISLLQRPFKLTCHYSRVPSCFLGLRRGRPRRCDCRLGAFWRMVETTTSSARESEWLWHDSRKDNGRAPDKTVPSPSLTQLVR